MEEYFLYCTVLLAAAEGRGVQQMAKQSRDLNQSNQGYFKEITTSKGVSQYDGKIHFCSYTNYLGIVCYNNTLLTLERSPDWWSLGTYHSSHTHACMDLWIYTSSPWSSHTLFLFLFSHLSYHDYWHPETWTDSMDPYCIEYTRGRWALLISNPNLLHLQEKTRENQKENFPDGHETPRGQADSDSSSNTTSHSQNWWVGALRTVGYDHHRFKFPTRRLLLPDEDHPLILIHLLYPDTFLPFFPLVDWVGNGNGTGIKVGDLVNSSHKPNGSLWLRSTDDTRTYAVVVMGVVIIGLFPTKVETEVHVGHISWTATYLT